jgi:hypothetical protein
MPPTAEARSRRWRWRGNPRLLLLILLLRIVLYPLLASSDAPLARIFNTLTVLAVIDLACTNRRDTIISFALGVPAILLTWLGDVLTTPALDHAAYAVVVALYLFVLVRMLRRLVRAEVVDEDTIVLAICSFLILGASWTLLYIPVEFYWPGSFAGLDTTSPGATIDDLFYFSHVTLTTLGYGDITPVSPLARSLAILEAVAGVLFTAVLIAMLLGKYTARSVRSRDE